MSLVDDVVIGFGAVGVGAGAGSGLNEEVGGWTLLMDSEAVAKSCSLGLYSSPLLDALIQACSKSLSEGIGTSRTLAPTSSTFIVDASATFDPCFCVNGR